MSSDNQHPDPSPAQRGPQAAPQAPQASASVIITLLAFTLAMIVAPVGSYFLTVDTVYSGNSTYAGVTAAVVANLILVAYLLVAFWEEDSTGGSGAESKKNR